MKGILSKLIKAAGDGPLSVADFEAILTPKARREANRNAAPNYWELALSIHDARDFGLFEAAETAYGVLRGELGEAEELLVVARIGEKVGQGRLSVDASRLGEKDLREKRAAANALGFGVAVGSASSAEPLVIRGDWCGRVEVFDYMVVGRASGPGKLECPEADVSRRHGEFFFCDGSWYYCDLDSTNGSRVNGRPVDGTCGPLAPGMTVVLADKKLIEVVMA